MNTELYLYGRCHIFALALSQVFGYEMEFFWDEEAWMDEDGEDIRCALVHAYCLLPSGQCVDARGVISKQEIEDEYEWNTPSFAITTEKEVQEWMNQGILDFPEEGELEQLIQFIHEHPTLYK